MSRPASRTRRTALRTAVVTGSAGVALTATAVPAAAHQTWFVDAPESYPLEWSALLRPVVLGGLLAVVALTLVWRAVAVRVGTPELPFLHRVGALSPWVPRLLALHLGVSLLALTLMRTVLDPAVHVPDGLLGTVLLLPQAAAGVLLLTGRFVVPAAAAVVAAGPVLLVLSGLQALFTCLVLVGVAGFLLLLPPDPARGGRTSLDPARVALALLVMRVGAAGSLVSLAVVEKLANPDMAVAMLEQQPVLNLLAPVGGSPAAFAVLAGLVEVLFGLLVLSGAAPQVASLVAAVPFTLTLALFGPTELVGHLPVYGVLLTLLVLGSDPRTAPLVRAVRLPDRPRVLQPA